ADELLAESLHVEEGLSGPSSAKVGRRLAELAAVKYQKGQYSEGLPLLERLEPIANQYSGQERFVAAVLFHCYALQAHQTNQPELAARFNTTSSNLGAVRSDFKCTS